MSKTLGDLMEQNALLTKGRDDLMDSPIKEAAATKVKLKEVESLKTDSTSKLTEVENSLSEIVLHANVAVAQAGNAKASEAKAKDVSGYNQVVSALQTESDKYVLPEEALNLPLKGSLVIEKGEGRKYQIDVSVPQDGSIKVDTPYKVAEVQGTTTFGSQGLHLGTKDKLLFNVQQINKGCISFEQGDQIFTDTVTGSQVTNADPKGVAEWTPNYNGVNSYVEFPEWKTEGDFEIEFDAYLTLTIRNQALIGYSGEGYQYIILNRQPDNSVNISVNLKLTGGKDEFPIPYELSDGFHSFRFVPSNKGCVVYIDNNEPFTITAGHVQPPFLNCIGQYKGIAYFKGQISNLKLIDKQNPDNSRFYSGIVYSYVDPDATDVPIPSSTVLVDEWGTDVVEVLKHTTLSPGVTESDGLFTWEAGSGTYVNYVKMVAGDIIEVTFKNIKGRKVRMIGVDNITFHSTDVTYITRAIGNTIRIQPQTTTDPLPCSVQATVKRIKTTNGTMHNFGTTQPYVPLLGDREEYCSNSTVGGYLRGIGNNSNTTGYLRGRDGSFGDRMPDAIPLSSICTSRGLNLITTGIASDVAFPWVSTAQHAFQYPNTFKVIKPTDIDYNNYAPDDWAEYTPNFNGVNSYIEIPRWEATNFTIAFDIYDDYFQTDRKWLSGNTRPLFGRFHANNFRYLSASGVYVYPAAKDGLSTVHIDNSGVIVNGVKSEIDIPLFIVNYIGSEKSAFGCAKGQLYNLHLTDLDSPDNSRFYPLIQKGNTMPKITQATEMLQGKHGTMYNFGETKPWVKMVDLSKMDVFPFKPPVSKIEIHHNGSDTEVHMQSQGEWNEMMNNLNMWYIQDTTAVTCNDYVVKDAGWLSNAQGYSAYNATLEGINLGINVGDLLTFMRPKGN